MFLNITLIVSLALITTAPFVYSLTCHCTTDPDEHTASADKEMLIEDRVAADEAEALQLVAQMKCLNQLCQVVALNLFISSFLFISLVYHR